MIPITNHYEEICKIPAHSLVELLTGERVHFRGVKPNDAGPKNSINAKAIVSKPFDADIQWLIPSSSLARYCCSIIDYEAIATL